MTFEEVLDHAIEMLRRRRRLTYRALKRQFDLDDDYLKDLKDELIKGQQLAADENGEVLVWTGGPGTEPESASAPPAPTDIPSDPQPVPAIASAAKRYQPDAERRQLTVMFCDLVDSTALSGQFDPEDLRDIIRAYQATCTDVIQRYDGHVAQLLGDGLLVYFGFPQAHEDDAQRAVHAGLGIVSAIGDLNTRLEPEKDTKLAVRLGLHTGLVVIGEMGGEGRQEQLALGETPNVAARIQGLAAPDTVIMSADTYRLTQGFFDCELLGEPDLRGVSQPIAVYRVLGARGVQSRLDVASTSGLTPLVGRESEVHLLIDRWHQATSGKGQVILLNAEPGLGKSRMVQALRAHLANEPYMRLECRSSPYYQHSAFYPIIDLIQRTLGWQQNDTEDEKLNKLEQTLSQYHPALAETVPVIAALLSISLPDDRYPTLHLTPQRQRQKTLETIVAMLLELAEREPVLFIVEDLHWTDPSTLELLDLLVDQTPTASIYTVLTCRPEFQSQWGHKSYVTQVTLNRLSRDDIEQMVARVAGGKALPNEIIEQLVDKTDGVPLYVEEMTKAILESGGLQETNGQYELTGSISSLSIPATLQDSLMSRLDRLGTAKAVAQHASVIGRQFSYELLQSVLQLDDTTLQRELRQLVDAELIYQRGLPPQATYVFKHALIVDVSYQSLLRSVRQPYHQRVAQTLEERFPETVETQPELLAHHYTQAGLNEPAVRYWQRSGQRANDRSAYSEAMNHSATGLKLLQTLPETLARHQLELPLQTALGTASLMVKGHTAREVEAAYTRARFLCQQLGDTQDVCPVLHGLWRFYVVRPDLPLARQLAEELLDLAKQRDEAPLYVMAHYAVGATSLWMGELGPAHRHVEAGIALYTPSQRHVPVFRSGQDPGVACRLLAAYTLWLRGYPDQALARVRDALTLSTELAHPFSYCYALYAASMICQLRRKEPCVYDYAEAAVALSTEQEFKLFLAVSTTLRGWALSARGEGEKGLKEMHRGMMGTRAAGAESHMPYFLSLIAEGYRDVEQVEAGLDTLKEGVEVMVRTGVYWLKAEMHRLEGELLLHQARPDWTQAETCFQRAIEVSRSQQAKSWELRASTSLARLWQSQDRREDAHDLLAPVYEWFIEGFDTADLIDAKALLDELTEGVP